MQVKAVKMRQQTTKSSHHNEAKAATKSSSSSQKQNDSSCSNGSPKSKPQITEDHFDSIENNNDDGLNLTSTSRQYVEQLGQIVVNQLRPQLE